MRKLLFVLGFMPSLLLSQDILWEKSYGGQHSEYLFDAQPTADYGFILAGSSLSEKTGNKSMASRGDLDYWIWKMDEHGELDWQKSFGGSGMDLLKSIMLTNDGGFILAGSSDSPKGLDKKEDSHGQSDYWVIKIDAKGGEQWQLTIGGSGQDDLKSIIPTLDGGYILGGTSNSDKCLKADLEKPDYHGKIDQNFGSSDFWLIKLNSAGKIEWQKTLGGDFLDVFTSIQQVKDKGYIVGGYSNSPESGNKISQNFGAGDFWVIKLDEMGEVQWQQSYGGEEDDQLFVVQQSFDNNIYLAGSSISGTSGNKSKSNQSGTDCWLIKIDTRGEVLWQDTYNIGKVDLLTSVIENDDHSILLGCYAASEVGGSAKVDKEDINDYVVLKLDEKGDEKWRKVVGSNGQDILVKAFESRDGGYILAGTAKGKVSRDRNSAKGRDDFWVVKLKDKDKPDKNPELIEAIPNPALNFTNIIVGYEFVKGTATVYDLSGRQIQSFVINSRTVPLDLGSLPEGIYVVQIKTDESTDSVKVIKGITKN